MNGVFTIIKYVDYAYVLAFISRQIFLHDHGISYGLRCHIYFGISRVLTVSYFQYRVPDTFLDVHTETVSMDVLQT
jgi:hypothetical protein